MPKRTEEELNLDAQKAALLASRGQTQVRIAETLGTSQASVSRLLDRAKENKWLRDEPTCFLSSERQREIDELIYADGLVTKLKDLQPPDKRHLNEVRIFDIGERPSDSEDAYHERLTALGACAAEYFVRDLFDRMRSVGITWGATLQYLLAGLRGFVSDAPFRTEPIRFIPVCGNPPDIHRKVLRSSSNLVGQLDECLNARSENRFNFTGVPASIPSQFQGQELSMLQRYFRSIDGYRRVFGSDGQVGAINNVDSIITSVGSHESHEDPWLKASADELNVPEGRLSRLTYGNIGGLFLARQPIEPEGVGLLEEMQSRWTGIQLEDFARCAAAAADNKAVGVVIVASGNKSEIVRECVSLGLASRLVIDQELAAALSRSLRVSPEPAESVAMVD